MSTAAAPIPERLRERYGQRPARPGRLRLILVLGGIALALLAIGVGARVADQPVRAQSIAYEHASARSIELTYQVTMRPGTRALCAVQALDASRGQVGFREVEVGPQTEAASVHSVRIATQGPPVSAAVMTCRPV